MMVHMVHIYTGREKDGEEEVEEEEENTGSRGKSDELINIGGLILFSIISKVLSCLILSLFLSLGSAGILLSVSFSAASQLNRGNKQTQINKQF